MTNAVIDIGAALLSNTIQILAGCVLSIPMYYYALCRKGNPETRCLSDTAVIGLSAVLGLIIPFGLYGAIPIFVALYTAGYRIAIIFPFLISNSIFNMLIPYTEASFIWKTGINRVVLAFIAAILAGLTLKRARIKFENIMRRKNMPVMNAINLSEFAKYVSKHIGTAAIYLLLGAILNVAFRRHIMVGMISFLYTNPHTVFMPLFFSTRDVTNPLFTLTMIIIGIMMNIINFSALLSIFKYKAVAAYYLYLASLALLLALSVF